MPRGSRHLAEPTLYRHPDTRRERTATTKVEAVSYEADGYRRAAVLDGDVEPADTSHLRSFDPAQYTVAAVNAYLETASAEERVRVLDAEAAGKNRAGVNTAFYETPEPNSGSDE